MVEEALQDRVTLADGRLVYAPVFVGRPLDPDAYSIKARLVWLSAVSELGHEPPVPEDPLEDQCDDCMTLLYLGGRQREAIDIARLLGLRRIVICVACAPHRLFVLGGRRKVHG